MLDDIGVWLFSGPGAVVPLVAASIVAMAIGVAVSPAIAAARWAARGRTRLVRPSCRRCAAMFVPTAGRSIAERCQECGAETSSRRAVRWTTRGSRLFSLTVTLPTMLAAAVGIGAAVGILVSDGLTRWQTALVDLRIERAIATSREELLARLAAIEQGVPTGDMRSLAERLAACHPSAYTPYGQQPFEPDDPFLLEVRAFVERLLEDPGVRIPRRVPATQEGEIAWDLVRLLPELSMQEASLERLLGPVRMTSAAEVMTGVPSPLVVEAARFARQLRFAPATVLADGVAVPVTVDTTGALQSGFLWTPPALRADEPFRDVLLTVRGTIDEPGPFGGGPQPLLTVERSIPVRVSRTALPRRVEDGGDPFVTGSGCIEGACATFDGASLGWLAVRAAEGIGFVGTVEAEEDGVWRPLARLTQPSRGVLVQWLRATTIPPVLLRVRIRPELDGPPCIGVGRQLGSPPLEIRHGSWMWELEPLSAEEAKLADLPVGDTRYVGRMSSTAAARPPSPQR